MKEKDKVFNLITTISCVVMIFLLYSFLIITDNNYYNGYIIFMFLCMLLNPIANLCRLNKKFILNKIYYLIVITLSSYISYICINSILIYNKYLNGTKDNSDAVNNSVNYFDDRFIYIAGAVIFTLLLALILKKHKIKSNKDNSILMLIIILITSLVPIVTKHLGTMNTIQVAFNIAEIIFAIIILFKVRGINTASELRGYYLILIIASLMSANPIALVLAIYLFIQLDTFGLHI